MSDGYALPHYDSSRLSYDGLWNMYSLSEILSGLDLVNHFHSTASRLMACIRESSGRPLQADVQGQIPSSLTRLPALIDRTICERC